jgi:hypothetical protein
MNEKIFKGLLGFLAAMVTVGIILMKMMGY